MERPCPKGTRGKCVCSIIRNLKVFTSTIKQNTFEDGVSFNFLKIFYLGVLCVFERGFIIKLWAPYKHEIAVY